MTTQEGFQEANQARNSIERAIDLAEIVVKQVQEDVTNTVGTVFTAKHILENLQLCKEAVSSDYDGERLYSRILDQSTICVVTKELQLCVEARGAVKESVLAKFVAAMLNSRKKDVTRRLMRVRELSERIRSAAFASIPTDNKISVDAENSYSPLQLLKNHYVEGKVMIDDKYYERGVLANMHKGLWMVDGKPRQISVKIFRMGRDDRLFNKRISDELRISAKLRHTNVLEFLGVRLTNTGSGQARLGIVTPFCGNGDSSTFFYLRKISNHEMLDFLRKSADAITFLHENYIVHGDVKPSNILVKDDGTPAICDFGNSRIIGKAIEDITAPEVLRGTLRYMPSETIRADDDSRNAHQCLTFAGDVWSFGMTALELMSGHIPYHTCSDYAVLGHLFKGELPAHEDYEAVPQLVWAIITRCWTLEPITRPSMHEIKCDMDTAWSEDDLGPSYVSSRIASSSPESKPDHTISSMPTIPDSERNSDPSLSSSSPHAN